MAVARNWKFAARAAVAALALFTAGSAEAQVYINELYFDPPGGLDLFAEYIELRGTPNQPLDNHYLVFVECEGLDAAGMAGEVENIYDLTGMSLGSNGFLYIPQLDSPYAFHPDAAMAFPNGTLMENSGFTAMLVTADKVAPFLGLDLDQGNDGLDPVGGDQMGWRSDWTVLDSVGLFSEADEPSEGRLYGAINFGPGPSPTSDGTYVEVPYEIEYLGRWGNSTGQTADDWHVTNLTDNAASGYGATGDFRQSAEPHGIGTPGQIVETNQGVPYGANLTDTIGSPNYILGDGNGDGRVDGADFTIWGDNFGLVDSNPIKDLSRYVGDFNNDGAVDGADFTVWADHFGQGGAPPAAAAVPEPSSLALAAFGAALAAVIGLRRRALGGEGRQA